MQALGVRESRSNANEGVYMSESGLCSLVIGSKQPYAKVFGR